MLEFSTEMFNYFKEDKTFSQESSSLNLHPKNWNSMRHTPVEDTVKLVNPKTGNSKEFYFTHADISDGEAYGWNYESDDNLHLLIIND